MAYSPAPAAPIIDVDYDRDCPRCGSGTYTTSNNGTRYCESDSCPWCVVKGSL